MKQVITVLICVLFMLIVEPVKAVSLFTPRKNYCLENQCSYEKEAPGTLFLIHGMNSSMNPYDSNTPGKQYMGTYVNLARFLETLGVGKANFKVYGVDYNANGEREKGTIKIQSLNSMLTTCNGDYNWSNCWDENQKWETEEIFKPNTLTIRMLSSQLQKQLIQMAKQKAISNPVTLIGHSMGGLVIRDLLYHTDSDENITGYELLKQNGVVINEVITLGTPHDHGFTGSEYEDYRKFSCRVLDPSIPLIHQFCMLTDWVEQLQANQTQWSDGSRLEINKLDFPQIHWVAVAGFGLALPDNTAGDGLVAYYSALNSRDGAERFHQRIGLKTSTTPNHDNPIPGQNTTFPPGADAVHGNINAVGLFPNLQSCKSPNLKYPSITCTGFFQYIIHKTTLCKLPGYHESNAYYRDNPSFSPQLWGCDS